VTERWDKGPEAAATKREMGNDYKAFKTIVKNMASRRSSVLRCVAASGQGRQGP
jgi:hypothetical protein